MVIQPKARDISKGDAEPLAHTQRKRGRASDHLPQPTTASTLATEAQVHKRRRKTAKTLSGIMELPVELFFEITSHLSPLDLLHLSRTSKGLRKAILAKNSSMVWKRSIASVEGLPACPEDMQEPVYVALVFDRNCFLCGAKGSNWVDYAIRLRLCKACRIENIKEARDVIDDLSRYKPGLQFIPRQGGNSRCIAEYLMMPGVVHKFSDNYYVQDLDEMVMKLDGWLAEDEESKRRKISGVKARYSQAVEIIMYMQDRCAEKTQSNRAIKEKRTSDIKSRLIELDYKEEDFPHNDPEWMALLRQPKALTDYIWKNLLPKLTHLIATRRDREEARKRTAIISARAGAVLGHYNVLLQYFTKDQQDLMPNAYDLRELPSISALIEADGTRDTVSYDEFLAISPSILYDIQVYETEVRAALVALICETSPAVAADLAGLDPATALRRYPSAFWCPCFLGCIQRPQYKTYQQAHAHWREVHGDMPFVRQRPWPSPDKRVNVPRVVPFLFPRVARQMLVVVGIPLNTELGVLDKWVKCGWLFCTCGDPNMPPPSVMDWVNLVVHVMHHKSFYHRRTELMRQNAHPLPNAPAEGQDQPFLYEDHPLTLGDPAKCSLKFLPGGADMMLASYRLRIADDAQRAQITHWLKERSDGYINHSNPVCNACLTVAGLTLAERRKVKRHLHLLRFLASEPDEAVWHMSMCHRKRFEKQDILWLEGDEML